MLRRVAAILMMAPYGTRRYAGRFISLTDWDFYASRYTQGFQQLAG